MLRKYSITVLNQPGNMEKIANLGLISIFDVTERLRENIFE